MGSNRTVELTASICNHQVVEAVRMMILDNEDFDHRYWSISNAETFERAAQLIREGYRETGQRITEGANPR